MSQYLTCSGQISLVRGRGRRSDMIKSKMEVMHALWIRGIQEDLLAVSI